MGPLTANPPMGLTDYQRNAIAAAPNILDKNKGRYIAEVVGLGKTHIGAEFGTARPCWHPKPATLQQRGHQG